MATSLKAERVTIDTLPRDLVKSWRTPDGRMRIAIMPKGNVSNDKALAEFTRAVLAVGAGRHRRAGRYSESADTVISAFFQAGGWALLSIAILLWLTLGRIQDVLLTLGPLLLAGVVTLELCVILDMPLNFANIIALPLLLGVGVAFKIYYIMAWRAGQTNLAAIGVDARRHLQRAGDRHRLRQPLVLQPSRHLEHGTAAGAVAALHAGGGRLVPAAADGQAARSGGAGTAVAADAADAPPSEPDRATPARAAVVARPRRGTRPAAKRGRARR